MTRPVPYWRRSGHSAGDRRGIAVIEFALILPVLLLLLLGSVDLVVWLEHWFRVEQTASAVANLVAQADAVDSTSFGGNSGFFAVANDIAQPLTVSGSAGATIISCISNTDETPVIGWQYSSSTNPSYTSQFGQMGGAPSLPPGFALSAGESVIVAEIYSGGQPWTLSASFFPGNTTTALYSYAIYQPRLRPLC